MLVENRQFKPIPPLLGATVVGDSIGISPRSLVSVNSGLKVRIGGIGGLSPPAFSSALQLRREWGGRLREGIREMGKW